MNYNSRFSLRLLPRNEGKIKSHESCVDFRAWSHDQCMRTRYLKEWIKTDMPLSVPFCSLSSISKTMTLKTRKRVPPRCHPDCKSKVILNSIASSCHAMKECMKNDDEFNEYFEEEDFESSHWPCDRCIEALKTIKMLWKCLVRKVFNVTIPEEQTPTCQRSESVKTLVKTWQKEIETQAFYVTSVKETAKSFKFYNEAHSWNGIHIKKPVPALYRDCRTEADKSSRGYEEATKCSIDKKSCRTTRKKNSRSANKKVYTVDTGCSCNLSKNMRDSELKKSNEEHRKQQSMQSSEIERLRKENKSLRDELDSVYKTFTWKAFYNPESNKRFSVCLIPKEKGSLSGNDVDSETVITMKECTHRNFRHVALLQIVRKTNNPTPGELISNGSCSHKGNPVEILTKVQSTFGAVVRNELSIATERKRHTRRTNIEASSRIVTSSRSVPSFTSSLSDFVSAIEGSGHNV